MVVEPGCVITKLFLTTKIDKTRFFFAENDELGTQETIVTQCRISINQI